MINEKSLFALSASRFSNGFLKPLYDTYSFSQIPQTIHSLFGCAVGGLPKDCIQEGPYERVILILIDGLGWKFLMQYGEKYPFLKRFFDQGIVSKISSQFPSTTAAHMTTLCCNQAVGEHGVYEWFMYEPHVNRVIAPLLYNFAGEKRHGTLESVLDPARFFPRSTLFHHLKEHQINSTIFQHVSITDSTYSNWMSQGADRVGYKTWPEGLSLLRKHLENPGFFYIYYSDFDSEAHRHGLSSSQVLQALDRAFLELENFFLSTPEINNSSTALLLTADHGMIDIDPSATVYLNQRMPLLEKKLKKGADGHVLAPSGSCRDFFLHILPSDLPAVQHELEDLLKGIAAVYPVSQLAEEGFFGPGGVSECCQSRMASLVILPMGSNSVWWHKEGHTDSCPHAMHGGLTPDELETVFLFYRGLK